MKKSHLKQFIKEEIRSVLKESINEAVSQYKHAVQKALKANGYNLKQSEVKIGAKKVRGMGTKITLNGEMIGFDDDIPKMIANFTKAIKDDPKKYGLKESVNEGFLADLPTWVWTLSYAAPFLWMTWEILVSGFEDGKLRRKLSPSGWVELIKLFLKKSKTKQIINTLSQDPEIKSMMGDVKSGKEKQWKLKNLLRKKMSDKQKDVVKQEFDSIAKRLLNKESVNESDKYFSLKKGDKLKVKHPEYKNLIFTIIKPKGDGYEYIAQHTKGKDINWASAGYFSSAIKRKDAELIESVNEGEKEALLGDPKMDKAWAKKVDGLSKSQLQKEKDRLHKAGFGHGNQWSGSKENMIKFKYVDQLLKESINEDQFEASLDDKQKYKMGSMWFKRWFKPKKEQDGWTWEDDGRYIWLTRPKMKHPTVRFEKETGFLQGNWKDPREMQWE